MSPALETLGLACEIQSDSSRIPQERLQLTIRSLSQSLNGHGDSLPAHIVHQHLVGSHWDRLCIRPLCGVHSRLDHTTGVVGCCRTGCMLTRHHTAGCTPQISGRYMGLCTQPWWYEVKIKNGYLELLRLPMEPVSGCVSPFLSVAGSRDAQQLRPNNLPKAMPVKNLRTKNAIIKRIQVHFNGRQREVHLRYDRSSRARTKSPKFIGTP